MTDPIKVVIDMHFENPETGKQMQEAMQIVEHLQHSCSGPGIALNILATAMGVIISTGDLREENNKTAKEIIALMNEIAEKAVEMMDEAALAAERQMSTQH